MNVQLPSGRRRLIQQRLVEAGQVFAVELAAEFDTSEDTIRRDLREMAAAGLCTRVYGGALPVDVATASIKSRGLVDPDIKSLLATIAVRLVAPDQFIAIDAGSTNIAIAKALPRGMPLSVVTNAPAIVAVLVDRPEISLHILGGRYDPRSGAALGTRTCREAADCRPDIVFIGACAIDLARGVTAFSPEEADLKQILARNAATVVTAASSDKLGKTATFVVVSASGLDHLVTEANAPPAVLRALRGAGVNVIQPSGHDETATSTDHSPEE